MCFFSRRRCKQICARNNIIIYKLIGIELTECNYRRTESVLSQFIAKQKVMKKRRKKIQTNKNEINAFQWATGTVIVTDHAMKLVMLCIILLRIQHSQLCVRPNFSSMCFVKIPSQSKSKYKKSKNRFVRTAKFHMKCVCNRYSN